MNTESPQDKPPNLQISNQFPSHVTTFLLFLAAIGIPSGLILGWITQHPWLAFVIWLLYELGILFIAFLNEVWQRLKSPLIDQVVERITWWTREIFLRYRQHYCQYVIYEHQVFDVKGLTTRAAFDLELEQVFVELNVDPTPAYKTSSSLIRIPEPLRQGAHNIWEYLGISTSRHFVIIGPPGSGKTTLLKHIALTLAQWKKSRLHVPRFHKIPFFLNLREHAETIKNKPSYSLIDAIQNHVRRKWQQTISPQWISHYLTKGNCVVLLDGLDEVADVDTRKQVAEWIQLQILAYGQNPFLLTSRPHGYRDNPLDGVTILEVCPFTPKQVERFIQNWYLANELKSWRKDDPSVQMRAREGAEDLLKRLHRMPTLLTFATNPLLLTMIATVHRHRASLPGKRVALYGEICEVFLGKRRETIGIAQELNAVQKQQVLQPLAYYLMRQESQMITFDESCQVIRPFLERVSMKIQPEQFIHMVQETSGLFLEREIGIYSFAHKTFQEYLTAVHIKEYQLEQELVDQIGNSWWHETIRLYCAQADATEIIKTCLEGSHPSATTLALAFECFEEKLTVDPSVTRQIDTLLRQGLEDLEPERRKLMAEAFLQRRLHDMTHLHNEVFASKTLITCGEYQIFLDEKRALGKFLHPDHWNTTSFPLGHGHLPVLGVRYLDAITFCDWLTQREANLWYYRLPRESELKDLEELEHTNVSTTAGTGYWVEEQIIRIPLIRYLEDNAVQILQHMLIFTYNSDYALALAFARGLKLNFKDAYAVALDRAQALKKIRNIPFNSGLFNFALPLLDETRSASILDLNVITALTLAGTLIRDPHQEKNLADILAQKPYDALSLPSNFDLKRLASLDTNIASKLSHDLNNTLKIVSDLAGTLLLDLAKALDFARLYQRDTLYGGQRINILHWYIRFSTLTLIHYFSRLLEDSASFKNLKRRSSLPQLEVNSILEQAFRNVLDIYITFVVLEARKSGSQSAWEGILLVKERKLE